MRLKPCKPGKKHYFNKSNICVHCGLDYNKVLEAIKKAEDMIDAELVKDAERALKVKI